MATSLRSSLADVLAGLSRWAGTFLAVVWLCAFGGSVLARVAGISMDGVPISGQLVVLGVLLVAAVLTGWLTDGGYERLGADPAGATTFAVLAIFALPFAFAPVRLALGFLIELPLLDFLFIFCTTVAAGWLAFYGGLERLGLAPDDFIRVLVYVIALGAVLAVVALVFDPAWLTDDRAAAAVVIALQFVACWLGFTKNVP